MRREYLYHILYFVSQNDKVEHGVTRNMSITEYPKNHPGISKKIFRVTGTIRNILKYGFRVCTVSHVRWVNLLCVHTSDFLDVFNCSLRQFMYFCALAAAKFRKSLTICYQST